MPKLSEYLISSEKHYQMCQLYEENQMNVNNEKFRSDTPDRKFNETKLVWYPLEIIEKYIQLVKSAVDAKSGEKVSGIGIYLTAHKDNGPENPDANPRIYSRRMTVNLVPTVDTTNLKHTEYAEPEEGDYNGWEHKPVIIGRKAEEGEKMHIIDNLCEFNDIQNINMILERGHAIPPPPNNG